LFDGVEWRGRLAMGEGVERWRTPKFFDPHRR
jgi:hypothetical protein